MAYLVGTTEDGAAVKIDLPKSGEAILGRSPERATVVVSAPSVSGCHCSIAQVDGAWVLKDLGSTNGTRLNGEVVSEAKLFRGDKVSLGDFSLVLEGEDVPERTDASVTPRVVKAVAGVSVVIPPVAGKVEAPSAAPSAAAAVTKAREENQIEDVQPTVMMIAPKSVNSPTSKALPAQFRKRSAHTRKWVALISIFAILAIFLVILFVKSLI